VQQPGVLLHHRGDFEVLLGHLREMVRYEVSLYAHTLMSNRIHLLLEAPTTDALGHPLRWLMTETARKDVRYLFAGRTNRVA